MDKIEITTIGLLRELDIPAHLHGYKYIKSAVSLVHENSGLLGSVTKELYPNIAKIHSTKPSRVERGIRHAIELCQADQDTRKKIIGTPRENITNSHFIGALTESVKLRLVDNQ